MVDRAFSIGHEGERADERRVPQVLAPIDRYLSLYRPVLARSDNKVSALWLPANDATPITANHVTDLISAATRQSASREAIRPAVRLSAARVWRRKTPHLGSALLHTDPDLINEHYNRASSLTAAEFPEVVRQLRGRPTAPAK